MTAYPPGMVSGAPVGTGVRLLLRRLGLALGALQVALGVLTLKYVFPDLDRIGCQPENPLGVWACNAAALQREAEFAIGLAALMLASAWLWPERWHASLAVGGVIPGFYAAYLAAISWLALLFAAAGFAAAIAAGADYWRLRSEREQEMRRVAREHEARRRFRRRVLPPGIGKLPGDPR